MSLARRATALGRVGGALVLGGLAVAACDREPGFGTSPDGFASVTAQAYLDYDGQPGFGGFDAAAPGLRFQMLLPGSNSPVASGVADENGRVRLDEIPVGTYDLRVDPGYLADTLIVTAIDTTRVTLSPDDAVSIQVGVTPPTRTMAQARALPEGRRVWITGMVLNTRGNSIDGSVHILEEGSGAMRVVFPSATGGAPRDSARVLGRTVANGGRRHLVDGLLRVLASDVRSIRPSTVTIDEARTAGGGALDARLVQIEGGTVTGVVTIPFLGVQLTVSNGGSAVRVILPQQNGFGTPNIAVGTPVNSAAGLLVPEASPAETWWIVPRGPGDVSLGPPPPGG